MTWQALDEGPLTFAALRRLTEMAQARKLNEIADEYAELIADIDRQLGKLARARMKEHSYQTKSNREAYTIQEYYQSARNLPVDVRVMTANGHSPDLRDHCTVYRVVISWARPYRD